MKQNDIKNKILNKTVRALLLLVVFALSSPQVGAVGYTYTVSRSWLQTLGANQTNGNHVQSAVAGGAIYTLPAGMGNSNDVYHDKSNSNSAYWSYLTLGIRIVSGSATTWSGGNHSNYFGSSTQHTEAFIAGPQVTADTEGNMLYSAIRANSTSSDAWANSLSSVAICYNTALPVPGTAGTRSNLAIPSGARPLGRNDFMTAYGNSRGTGSIWVAPVTPNGTTWSGSKIERINITGGAAKNKTQFNAPTTIRGTRAFVRQYGTNKVMFANNNYQGTTTPVWKGTITIDNGTTGEISWTPIPNVSSYSSQVAVFDMIDAEFVAYSSSKTEVTIRNITTGTNLTTFSLSNTESATSYTYHSINVDVHSDKKTADIYVYVPGVAGAKYTIVAKDATPPVIERAITIKNDETSFYCYAYATDNFGVNKVAFPAWSDDNWQDDLAANWQTTQVGSSGNWTIDGQTYNWRYLVKRSDHNNDMGLYHVHPYAYDAAGNESANNWKLTYSFSRLVKIVMKGLREGESAEVKISSATKLCANVLMTGIAGGGDVVRYVNLPDGNLKFEPKLSWHYTSTISPTPSNGYITISSAQNTVTITNTIKRTDVRNSEATKVNRITP